MRPSMLNDPNVDDAAKADGATDEVTEPVTEETPTNDLSEL